MEFIILLPFWASIAQAKGVSGTIFFIFLALLVEKVCRLPLVWRIIYMEAAVLASPKFVLVQTFLNGLQNMRKHDRCFFLWLNSRFSSTRNSKDSFCRMPVGSSLVLNSLILLFLVLKVGGNVCSDIVKSWIKVYVRSIIDPWSRKRCNYKSVCHISRDRAKDLSIQSTIRLLIFH